MKRIFDYIADRLQSDPDNICFARKIRGEWSKINAATYHETTDKLAAGLLNNGIKRNDNVVIISENRPEWNIIDLALMKIGAVTVPVYTTISNQHLISIINETEAKVVFLSNKFLYRKMQEVMKHIDNPVKLYSFDQIEGVKNYMHLSCNDPMEEISLRVKKTQESIGEDDTYTILYTSGTTGSPKGVMLSHRSHLAVINQIIKRWRLQSNYDVVSYLPLNHSFEKTITYVCQIVGMSVHYAEGLSSIIQTFQDVKPDFFVTVPMLLEKVYENILKQGESLESPFKEKYYEAIQMAVKYDNNIEYSDDEKAMYEKMDEMFYSKWRAILGGNLKTVVCGGAKIEKDIFHLFWAAKIPLLQGYGLTETSGVISVDSFDEKIKLNKCGKALNELEVKLGYDNEILARGKNIMNGYYKHPELTKEIIDKEGWLHTGDVGEIDEDGYIEVVGRIKSSFKNSAGKYIYPENIENTLKKSTIIKDIVVAGINKPYLVAIITPDFDMLSNYDELKNLSNEETINNKLTVQLVRKEIDKYNREFWSDTERIVDFRLVSDVWSIETGEYTPTLKIRRNFILEKYKEQIDNIYNQ